MTDASSDPIPADEAAGLEAEQTQDTSSVAEDTGTDEDTGRGNPEAAKWRRHFRAEQADRKADQDRHATEMTVLQARVDQMVRNEIQRVATETLADGNDFWREDVDVTELCDATGLPDADKVRAHAETLIQSHQHWARRRPATPPASTVTSDRSPYDSADGVATNWAEVLRGGAGG